MATRYRHVTSGAVVSVRDDKAMGSEWEPVKPEKKPVPRKAPAKSDEK